MGYPIHISSDNGLLWGNHSIPPALFAKMVGDGVEYKDGLLTFDGIKVVNRAGSEYITNATGRKIYLRDMVFDAMEQ